MRSPGRLACCFHLLLLLLLASLALRAHADIGIVIADPTGEGSSKYTHAGHALLYLSDVCAETPVRARLCSPAEQGSIVTIFPNFHENQPYEWNIVPLSLYVDGTARPGRRLLYGSRMVKLVLAEQARREYLGAVCHGACPVVAHDYWRDLVAATIERDLFFFVVKSTHAQDERIVQWLNVRPNVNHYNALTNNCAMFVQELVNTIFPHSVHRDVLNDIGLMSPKAAAHSFSRWAERHPELGFYCLHFEQKPGDTHRSGTASSGTEAAIHIKKYLLPAALIGDHEVAGSFFVAYLLTGRFGLYKEYQRYPVPSLILLDAQKRQAKRDGDAARSQSVEEAMKRERTASIGTKQTWEVYRQRFAEMTSLYGKEAERERERLQKCFRYASVSLDGLGDAWLVLDDGHRVGIYDSNVLDRDSDPALAYELMEWRIGSELKAKGRIRPGLPEFQEDWELFVRAAQRLHPTELAGAR